MREHRLNLENRFRLAPTKPMKHNLLSIKHLCVALALAAPSFAATINFDDQDTSGGAVQLTNQYASSGVLFSNIYAAQNFKFNIVPPSTPNYASPFWVDTNPGFITFVDPSNSAVNASVDTVSFTLVGLTASSQTPGNFSGAIVDALDLGGNIIAGQSETIPGTAATTANEVLTFTGDIHELRFTHVDGTSGALPIDDLVVGAITPVPEPSLLGLLGVGGGLLALGVYRLCRERAYA
jgi:hypothetical protein